MKTRGQKAPVHSLDEILASALFDKIPPSAQGRLKSAQSSNPQGPDSDACKAEAAYREAFGAAVTKAMDEMKLDAFVYPTWNDPPRLIESTAQGGDNSQVFSPTSGFPAINVPMGYTRDGQLPAGMTIFGRAWDEARLIKLAYAYEQATNTERPQARFARAFSRGCSIAARSPCNLARQQSARFLRSRACATLHPLENAIVKGANALRRPARA